MKCRTGKRRFPDELSAKIALARRINQDRGEKRYYACTLCSGFHMTSQDQKTERNAPLGIDKKVS